MSEAFKINQMVEMISAGDCYKCGVPIMLTSNRHRICKEKGSSETFYCLNGHGQAYCKSTVTVLEEKLKQEQQNTEWYRRKFEQESKSKSVYMGKLTIIKNRIQNGVCPCCNRTFKNLQRHMATKHKGDKY